MESDANRLTIVGPPFGIQVLVGAATVWAIFTAGFAESQGVPGVRPALTCRTVDVAGVARGTAVTVPGSGNFTVVEERADGTGISRISMERA